ncbi:MAG: DNA-processing protein DprA [Patescibacteria group bacterium]
MTRDQKPHLHAFNTLQCIGPKGLAKLSVFFNGDLTRAWSASEALLCEAGISEEMTRSISQRRAHIDPNAEYEQLIKLYGEPIALDDDNYPALLKETSYAPLLIYVRGHLSDAFPIAIVGTRRPTHYGKEACHIITRELSRAGICIVSGLALGIDGIAHETVLEEKGRTIAVLGSGIDDTSIYPRFHIALAKRIIENGGAIISEFPPGTTAMKHHFPQRNRIIAGISKGTTVIEAREGSGALITARYALEYNRDVFALPGSIFSMASSGPHALIRQGAELITSAEEILKSYGIEKKKISERIDAEKIDIGNELEKKILSLLEESLAFDDIASATGAPIPILNSALVMLELKNYIKNIGNKTYIRI